MPKLLHIKNTCSHVDEHTLPGSEVGKLKQHLVSCDVVEGNGGCMLEAHLVWEAVVLLDFGVLRPQTHVLETHHPLTLLAQATWLPL